MKITVTPQWTAAELEQAVRTHSIVEFAPGRYCLDRPLALDGLENRRLVGMPGACLCGGRPECVRWEALGGDIWRAQLERDRSIDGLRIGDASFRPARYPHAGDPEAVYKGTAADALDFAARCAHPEDGVLHALHAHLWGDMHYRIAGREEDGSLRLEGGWQNNRPMGMHCEYRFVENLREALGAPGEFFYDHRTGELLVCADTAPQEEILLIDNSRLLELRRCRGVQLENLIFADSARTFLEPYEALLRSDWRIYRGGAVFAEDCREILFRRCEFARIGSNALFFSGSVSDCCVEECWIHDIGASGICFVGKPSSVRFPCVSVDEASFSPEDLQGIGPKSEEYVRDCAVKNCLIRDVGRVEKQVACVEISMSARIRVFHCTMHTCPRAAVNVSEGTFGGHIIEFNDMFDTVRETGDHGSFNGWGRDRFWHAEGMDSEAQKRLALMDAVETTVLRGNRVRCDHGWDIDLDDGCSNYLVEDNLCLAGGLKFREGFLRTARRNRMINNTFHPHVWFENSGDVFEDNLVMRPYLPIGMPPRWGERVDGNVLAVLDGAPRPAAELRQLSGQDEHSVARTVPMDGELRPLDEALRARFGAPAIYGVTSQRLRALAKECPVDAPCPMSTCAEGKRWRLEELELKSIDTDGEMSAFAAPGHHGVLVLSIAPHSRWYEDGLRANTAILTLNGRLLNGAEHLIALCGALKPGDEMVLGVRTMFNDALEIHTRR